MSLPTDKPIEHFVIPAHKRLIIVRGAPTAQRELVAGRIAEQLQATARRLEDHFVRPDGTYRYNPEAVAEAILATRAAVIEDVLLKGVAVAAGTFIRRKHIMEYAYEGHVTKHEILVLEVVCDVPRPNESRRTPADLERLNTEREHYLHSFAVDESCTFSLTARKS